MFSVVWVVIELPSSTILFLLSHSVHQHFTVFKKRWMSKKCDEKEKWKSFLLLLLRKFSSVREKLKSFNFFPRAPSLLLGLGKLRNFRLSEYPLKISEGKKIFFGRKIVKKINKVKKGKNREKCQELIGEGRKIIKWKFFLSIRLRFFGFSARETLRSRTWKYSYFLIILNTLQQIQRQVHIKNTQLKLL